MALQQTVNTYQSVAVAGDRASMNLVIYTPRNYLAGEGGVTVGGFVWEAGNEADPEGVVATGSGTPLGFVERAITNFNYALQSDGTLQIAEGGLVAVAVFGDFWVEAPEAVSKGAAVYADTSTGAVSFTSGAATPYVTASSAEAGELVVISAWSGIVSGLSGSVSSGSGGGSSSVDLSGYMKTDFSNAAGTLSVENGGTGATSAANARTALGLGAVATLASIDLASNVSGTLPVGNGGTGLTALGTAGQVLSTNSEATAMEWASVNTDSVDLSNYMTVDFANATGTLDIAHGGTGLSTAGTDGQVLTSTGSALNYEDVPTQDLSGYATASQLSEISGTLTTVSETLSDVSDELANCAKTSDLSSYATTASLADYVTSSSLTSTLSSYATTASLDDYAKTADLGGLATEDSVNLASQVTGTLPIANGGTGNTTGNAATATQLETARTISLTGAIEGSASFDGSADVTITTTASASE